MPEPLTPAQLAQALAVRDLSDPAAGPHAVQLVVDQAVEALAARWSCSVRWWRGERIVTVADNYDNLGYHPGDVTRDARYTRYVDRDHVLRSHSSALIPGALRHLAETPADDLLLVCPGLVYRRDSIDRLHSGTPHQLDLWRITRRPATRADLEDMVAALVPGWNGGSKRAGIRTLWTVRSSTSSTTGGGSKSRNAASPIPPCCGGPGSARVGPGSPSGWGSTGC